MDLSKEEAIFFRLPKIKIEGASTRSEKQNVKKMNVIHNSEQPHFTRGEGKTHVNLDPTGFVHDRFKRMEKEVETSDQKEKGRILNTPQNILESSSTFIPQTDYDSSKESHSVGKMENLDNKINKVEVLKERARGLQQKRMEQSYTQQANERHQTQNAATESSPDVQMENMYDTELYPLTPDYDKEVDIRESNYGKEYSNFPQDPRKEIFPERDILNKDSNLENNNVSSKETPLTSLQNALLSEIKTFHKALKKPKSEDTSSEVMNNTLIADEVPSLAHFSAEKNDSFPTNAKERETSLEVTPDYDEIVAPQNRRDENGSQESLSKCYNEASTEKKHFHDFSPSKSEGFNDKELKPDAACAITEETENGSVYRRGSLGTLMSVCPSKNDNISCDPQSKESHSRKEDPESSTLKFAAIPESPEIGEEHKTKEFMRRTKSESDFQSSREIHMKALSELQTSSALRARPDVVYGTMIPEPDYSDDEGDSKTTPTPHRKVIRNNRVNANGANSSPQKENKCEEGRFDDKGLILPKKLANPCADSSDKKSLHRELLFNQKVGINVLNQKSELQKAMEKHKGKVALKEQEKEKQTNVSPLQRAIDERAQRLEKSKEAKEQDNKGVSEAPLEFQKVHAKFRSKIEAN